jgi:hypothetical protein
MSSVVQIAAARLPRRFGAWIVLAAVAALALCTVDVLPFYDYYLWLFQGHVVNALLFDSHPAPDVLRDGYHLSAVPVPNLAAPLLIGLLNTWLPVEVAGLVFVVATVLGFAIAFGFLVRAVQQQPTWVEYSGFLWAFGFFLYKGYLSYLVGLALAFVLTGVLHRITVRPEPVPQNTLWLLTALGAVLYLSHLIAWGIGMLALAVHTLVLARRNRGADARRLALTALPNVLLLAWYAAAEHGGSGLSFYPSLANKLISMFEPILLFLRIDPFTPAFPVFWVNVAAGLAVAALALTQLQLGAVRATVRTRPLLWLSGLVAALALLIPVDEYNDLIKPDERFVLPAVLLALAALPCRALRPATGAAVVGLVAAVVGLHVIEYAAVAPRIDAVDAATDAHVLPRSPLLQLAIPSRHGCAPASGLSVGVPALKWFGVDHVLETGDRLIELDETSIVHVRPDAGPPDLTTLTPSTPADASAAALSAAPRNPYVLVVACSADLRAVQASLTPTYDAVAAGDGFTLLSRHR